MTKQRIRNLITKIEETLSFDIRSDKSKGYSISTGGTYERVPDEHGYTETRTIHDGPLAIVMITKMIGPRQKRSERFSMDMEVELTRGDLVYTFPETGEVIRMELMKPIIIKAGVVFQYEFTTQEMACVFKIIKSV